ncbi:MAG: DUF4142 domain-containing protein [Verrucomicrobiota bacterium]
MKTNTPTVNALSWLRVATAVAAAGLATGAMAQTTVRENTVRGREVRVELKHGDRAFLEKAAKASHEEIEISRVAASRTSNPEVRRYAQMLVSDHDDAREGIAALASLKGVNLPAKDPVADRWVKRDGKSFDREYIDKMISTHEETVKLFDKQAKEGEDAETVAYARKHLPKLQAHLQQGLDLKRVLKAQD